ncbi:ribose-phosphate pyrophosphokinase [Patescibacteria group bacterium]|nr:ribose-phosphate pyrophosphokinase [Patescibacteria group bacterium]MBU1931584.1 ribose-phosphate pyrophosphokinase [Patescibacteria group bacterium]
MKVFTGSSNPTLAKKLAQTLKVPFGKVKLSRFSNGEARVWIQDKHPHEAAVIVQSLAPQPDQSLVEFTLIIDALKRFGVKKVIAVMPYLGYSKQDKVFRPGEPLSAKVIVQMLQTAAFDQLITFDLHNQAIVGFFNQPIIQLSAQSLFLNHFAQLKTQDTLIVAPDAGSAKSSAQLAQKLGLEVVYIDKARDLVSGKVSIKGISRSVKGKQLIIMDDMIVTGGTLIKAAEFLKKKGAVQIFVGATHHLYVPGTQAKISASPIDQLIVSDTIQAPKQYNKLKIISVAPLLAAAIKKL